MRCYRNTILVALVVCCAAVARADDYLTYEGTIDVGRSLGRIVGDPIRSKVYGITGGGDVVFMDRTSMSVENVIATGRALHDVDIHPSNDYLTVLDNITGEYWNQPPKVYVIDYDLQTQSPSRIVFADAPMYQMAHGRDNRIVGVGLNQGVSAYQVDATTGERLSSIGAGFYGDADWGDPGVFVANSTGTRVYFTDTGLGLIGLHVFDTSTDTVSGLPGRTVGSYNKEPVFINSTDTSLYVGDLRVDPDNVSNTLGVFPENILAATGNDRFAFGAGGVYDPVWGDRLQDMPAGSNMMALGEYERYLYAFDRGTQQLHVMSIVPEPSTLVALLSLAVTGLTLLVWRRQKPSAVDTGVSC